MATVYKLPDDHPFKIEMRELNEKGSIKPIPPWNRDYMLRNRLGFYSNFSDVDGDDKSSLIARKLACSNSPYVVSLTSYLQGERKVTCSGILVEHDRTKLILTSAYIMGAQQDLRQLMNDLEIKIDFLYGNKPRAGKVILLDEFHSIALVYYGGPNNHRAASLSTALLPFDAQVMAMGQNLSFGLMASRGKIKARNDKLESDDLISCTCTISESGIGGPIIDCSSGLVIGMSVYMQKKSSLFMPSTILQHCLEQLVVFGRVVRMWPGMKTRSLTEIRLKELELTYQSFPSTDGIIVKEVTSGTLAEKAGVLPGDLIISCNGIPMKSPVQLADLLLTMGKSHHMSHCEGQEKRTDMAIEVEIKRPSAPRTEFNESLKVQAFTPNCLNKWPLLPLEVRDNTCKNILFSSKVKNRTQEVGSSSNLKRRIGLSSIFHDIEQTESSSRPITDVIENVESTGIGIDSEISGVEMLGKPVCLTSISDTLFGNGLTTTSESTSNILQGDDPKKDDIWKITPHMKITPQDAVIHRDAPMNHQFTTNTDGLLPPC